MTRLLGHRPPSAAARLRDRCEERLAGLDVPEPFDLDLFVERLAEVRGRPLTLMPYPMAAHGSPCGMWVALADSDVIFVDAATAGTQRANIVAHELGHLVADHAADPELVRAYRARRFPDLDPSMVERVLGRTSFTRQEEQEAEVFAWLLLGRRAWRPHSGGAPGGPTISPSYIYQLRSGIRENPTLRHVQALAKYFGVEVAYFTDDAIAEQTDAQLAMLAAMRDAGVRSIALRAANLSPETLDLVSEMIDVATKMEGNRRRGPRGRSRSQDARPQDATAPVTPPAPVVRDSEPT